MVARLRVTLDLDVIVREGRWLVGFAHDRRAIDERPGLDQGSLEQQRVIRRDKKVARGNIFRDCAGLPV